MAQKARQRFCFFFVFAKKREKFWTKDSMRQRTEKREKFSFFYKRDFPQFFFVFFFIKKGKRKKKRTAINLFKEVLFSLENQVFTFFEPDLLHRTFLKNRGIRNSNFLFKNQEARHSIVPITASGTQDEKSLVDGEKFVREVGKLELYLRKKVWLGRNWAVFSSKQKTNLFYLSTVTNKGNPTV